MQTFSLDKTTKIVDFRPHFMELHKKWVDYETTRMLWEELKRANTEKLLTIVSEGSK